MKKLSLIALLFLTTSCAFNINNTSKSNLSSSENLYLYGEPKTLQGEFRKLVDNDGSVYKIGLLDKYASHNIFYYFFSNSFLPSLDYSAFNDYDLISITYTWGINYSGPTFNNDGSIHFFISDARVGTIDDVYTSFLAIYVYEIH